MFGPVFIAELGDKTQIAAFVFASNQESNVIMVVLAASLALITSTIIAVAAGSTAGGFVDQTLVQRIAGFLFVALGVYMLLKG